MTTDDNREREALAVDRITSPLDSGDFDSDSRSDLLLAFGRRGTRDAVMASCARRDTWNDTLARLAFSGVIGDGTLPLMTRQNVAMFSAVTAWRDDLLDVAALIIGQTPEWESHRGLNLAARIMAAGAPFDQWEANMRSVRIDTCLAFQG